MEPSSSSSSSFDKENEKPIFVKAPNARRNNDSDSVSMPTSSMTGSIVGKRFYKTVTTREAEDGNGWTVMLDYRTLKTPSKRPLKGVSKSQPFPLSSFSNSSSLSAMGLMGLS